MSKVEIESFLKSFILFFTSLGFLITFIYYVNYTKEISNLDSELYSKMKVCSYDLKCENFNIDFVEKNNQEFYTLNKKDSSLFAYFPISSSDDYILEFSYAKENYLKHLNSLQIDILIELSLVMVVVFMLSILFSLYSLSPLRNALSLTQEFIKDILHDFNTPLSTIRLNTSMLKKDEVNKSKVERIEKSVQNILDLQENLRAYLHNHELQQEIFDLKDLVKDRIKLIEKNYPSIDFKIDMQDTHIKTSKEAMKRILDNILSNAAKYNKEDGFVHVSYDIDNESLVIKDSGVGIKNPSKIFQRFYKEQERGIGIGLHIVKKLCDELNIDIKVESEVGVGTGFFLTLR